MVKSRALLLKFKSTFNDKTNVTNNREMLVPGKEIIPTNSRFFKSKYKRPNYKTESSLGGLVGL